MVNKFPESIENLALNLLKEESAKERLNGTLATTEDVLKLVAAGAFIAGSIVAPNLSKLAKPLIRDLSEDKSWKRFNVPYLKRKLKRLENQKLVRFGADGTKQVVEITTEGRKRIIKFALNDIKVVRPSSWNGRWWLVTYDIPKTHNPTRYQISQYLKMWGFYPLEDSVFLHAYPCEKEVTFLREFLGVGKWIRIFFVDKIENDKIFREFFGI